MTHRAFLLVVLGALSLITCWWVLRLEPAHKQAAAALAHEQQVEHDLARLNSLQGNMNRLAENRLPDNDVVTRIQQSMALAGLPAQLFQGIQPLGEQVDPNAQIRSRRIQVRFGGLTATQVGAWVAAWQSPEQPWVIEGIDFVHLDSDGTAGGFAVTVVLVVRSMEA